MGGKFVLPFCFKTVKGTRTSHHLIFVSKHPLGYKIMKKVMANQSSSADQGVASFEYNPADVRMPLLFELTRPLDDLKEMLLEQFAGKTMSMIEIYDAHNVDLPYTDSNYKEVLSTPTSRASTCGSFRKSWRSRLRFGLGWSLAGSGGAGPNRLPPRGPLIPYDGRSARCN